MSRILAGMAMSGALLSVPHCVGAQSSEGNYEDGSIRLTERFVGEDDYPASGVELGQGWDSYLGQRTQQQCIEISSTPGSIPAFTSRATFVDLFDREQLFRELKMSARASYGGMVSGRASFSRTVTIDSKYRNVLGKVFVNNGGTFVVPAKKEDGITLTEKARNLLKNNLDEFRRRCGDSFVTAIHYGGRYDAVFSLKEDSKEILERMRLSIKGGYGGFSGSASASSLLQKRELQERLTVETNQTGGQPGLLPSGVAVSTLAGAAPTAPVVGEGIYTAANIVKKISEFEKMDKGYARSYAISLESYKTASNYPQELLAKELYASNMLTLSANVWRYRELADLYSSAAAAPSSFYFPFTTDVNKEGSRRNEELTTMDIAVLSANKADYLYSAANCFEGWVAVCASRASCKPSDIFSAASLKKTCPRVFEDGVFWGLLRGVGATIEAQYRDVLNEVRDSADPNLKAMVPLSSIDSLISQASSPLALSVSGLVTASVPGPSTGGEPRLSDVPEQPQPANSRALPEFSSADVYYSMLAEAPMRRGPLVGVSPGGQDTDDEFRHVEWLCAAYANKSDNKCPNFAFTDIARAEPGLGIKPIDHNDPNVKHAAAFFRQWVTNERLMPLVRTYCAVAGHIMCIRPDRAILIANSLPVTFNRERNFATTPPPPIRPVVVIKRGSGVGIVRDLLRPSGLP